MALIHTDMVNVVKKGIQTPADPHSSKGGRMLVNLHPRWLYTPSR